MTRKHTEIWLIGHMSPMLRNTVLPSKKEVLSLFFHYKNFGKQTIKNAFHLTVKDVLEVWAKFGIPVRLKKHVVAKLKGLYKEWELLKKHKEDKAKRSVGLLFKENTWQAGLDDLFDIAHANAMKIINIQQVKEFLIAQRKKGRRGRMGNIDKIFLKQSLESGKRREKRKRKRELKKKAKESRSEKAILECSIPDTNLDQDEISTDYDKPSTSGASFPKCRRRGTKQVMCEKLAATMDMAKLSDREAALVLTPVLQHLGHDPYEYNVNRSSIRRERMKYRQKIAEGLKQEFKPGVTLCIHWDGKMLEDITGKESVDRLPILVSGAGVQQLLAVPKLSVGTGEATASAVHNTCLKWGLCEQVTCMSFDTTPVNTGVWNGACILLQQKMGKDMLWLACRHHILEIMLEAVVLTSLGASSGPDILIFKRFQKHWKLVDTTKYQTYRTDDVTVSALADIADDRITFAKNQLQEFQPRDDYKELLNLVIVFLDGVPPKEISFRAPAGLHRARWMAKVIYALKIWMFRNQFKLTKKEEKGLLEICIFTVRLFITAWYQAPGATLAPRLDLQLLKDIDAYKSQNALISQVALKKFMGHLWYLSEELVALAFFDDKVSSDTKRKMVRALNNETHHLTVKRAIVDAAVIQKKNLEDFVSSNTLQFFKIIGISSKFLEKDVEMWIADEEYQAAKCTTQHMKVVNDIAERGVALMDEYNKLLTNDEEQKQFLLLVVQKYRQSFPDRKKSTLIEGV